MMRLEVVDEEKNLAVHVSNEFVHECDEISGTYYAVFQCVLYLAFGRNGRNH